MTTVTIHEAKTHFSKLIKRALAGEEIIVARGKEPLIRLQPLPLASGRRVAGRCKALVKSVADDFDAPLSEFEEFMK